VNFKQLIVSYLSLGVNTMPRPEDISIFPEWLPYCPATTFPGNPGLIGKVLLWQPRYLGFQPFTQLFDGKDKQGKTSSVW
jgi:hypothetical protein